MVVTAVNHPSSPPSVQCEATSCLRDLHHVTLVKEVNTLAIANIQLTTTNKDSLMEPFKDLKRKLRDGECHEEKAKGNSPVWNSFVLIVNNDGNKVGAVKCVECNGLYKYDTIKTDTSVGASVSGYGGCIW